MHEGVVKIMKRILAAALAAVTAVCCTACGSSGNDTESAKEAAAPVQQEEPTGTQEVTIVINSEEPEVTTEYDDTPFTIDLTKPEPDESQGDEGDTVIELGKSDNSDSKATPAAFTFTADNSKWSVSQDDSKSASITYNGDDIDYAKGNCTIMINSRVVSDMADRTLGEVADAIIDSKGLTDSVEIVSRGESVLGGHDGYTLSCVYSVDKIKFDLDITILAEGSNVLEVWVMSYQDCTDKMQENFDEVLNTIKFA